MSKLCARCGIRARYQGEEVCEPCMNLMLLPQPSEDYKRAKYIEFIETFTDAIIKTEEVNDERN